MRKAAVAVGLTLVCLTGCASARVQFVSYIDDAGAQLRGYVGSSRTETGSYWFEWGRTPQLGHESAHTPIAFVAGESTFELFNLNNRDPETTYYWRLCADDQDPAHPDPGCSDVDSFTTTAAPAGKALTVGGGWDIVTNLRDRSLNVEGPLTFEGPAVLTLVDSYCASDRWRLFDNGVAIGRTGPVEDLPGCSPYELYFDGSFADEAHYSRGSFTLGAGQHSIRLRLLAGSGNDNTNTGYIRVDPLD
jgi:hypothetical protein